MKNEVTAHFKSFPGFVFAAVKVVETLNGNFYSIFVNFEEENDAEDAAFKTDGIIFLGFKVSAMFRPKEGMKEEKKIPFIQPPEKRHEIFFSKVYDVNPTIQLSDASNIIMDMNFQRFEKQYNVQLKKNNKLVFILGSKDDCDQFKKFFSDLFVGERQKSGSDDYYIKIVDSIVKTRVTDEIVKNLDKSEMERLKQRECTWYSIQPGEVLSVGTSEYLDEIDIQINNAIDKTFSLKTTKKSTFEPPKVVFNQKWAPSRTVDHLEIETQLPQMKDQGIGIQYGIHSNHFNQYLKDDEMTEMTKNMSFKKEFTKDIVVPCAHYDWKFRKYLIDVVNTLQTKLSCRIFVHSMKEGNIDAQVSMSSHNSTHLDEIGSVLLSTFLIKKWNGSKSDFDTLLRCRERLIATLDHNALYSLDFRRESCEIILICVDSAVATKIQGAFAVALDSSKVSEKIAKMDQHVLKIAEILLQSPNTRDKWQLGNVRCQFEGDKVTYSGSVEMIENFEKYLFHIKENISFVIHKHSIGSKVEFINIKKALGVLVIKDAFIDFETKHTLKLGQISLKIVSLRDFDLDTVENQIEDVIETMNVIDIKIGKKIDASRVGTFLKSVETDQVFSILTETDLQLGSTQKDALLKVEKDLNVLLSSQVKVVKVSISLRDRIIRLYINKTIKLSDYPGVSKMPQDDVCIALKGEEDQVVLLRKKIDEIRAHFRKQSKSLYEVVPTTIVEMLKKYEYLVNLREVGNRTFTSLRFLENIVSYKCFGPVTILLVQGDILEAKNDIIVNPVESCVNLSELCSSVFELTKNNDLIDFIRKSGNEKSPMTADVDGMSFGEIYTHLKLSISSIEGWIVAILRELDEAGYFSVSIPDMSQFLLQPEHQKSLIDILIQILPNLKNIRTISIHTKKKQYLKRYSSVLENTKSLVKKPLQKQVVVVWSWEENGSKWIPYSQSLNDDIEREYKAKSATYIISPVPKTHYVIDFHKMIQTNTSTKFVRKIKRVIISDQEMSLKPELKEENFESCHFVECFGENARDLMDTVMKYHDTHFKKETYSSQLSISKDEVVKLCDATSCDVDFTQEPPFVVGYDFQIDKFTTSLSKILVQNPSSNLSIVYPQEWGKGGFQMVTLDPKAKEFQDIESIVLFTHKCTILSIQRVENKAIWRQYYLNKQTMSNKTTKQLFHGTRLTPPETIYKGSVGFDLRYSGSGMWGNAIYFAEKASYSFGNYSYKDENGLKQVFYAEVAVGDSINMSPTTMKHPPHKLSSKNSEIMVEYDSVCGVTCDTTVYMIYRPLYSYPRYLITFK